MNWTWPTGQPLCLCVDLYTNSACWPIDSPTCQVGNSVAYGSTGWPTGRVGVWDGTYTIKLWYPQCSRHCLEIPRMSTRRDQFLSWIPSSTFGMAFGMACMRSLPITQTKTSELRSHFTSYSADTTKASTPDGFEGKSLHWYPTHWANSLTTERVGRVECPKGSPALLKFNF